MNSPQTLPLAFPPLHSGGARKWGGRLFLLAASACLMADAQAEVLEMESLTIDTGVVVEAVPGVDYLPGTALVLDAITLLIAPTGRLDLKNNALIVRTGSFATIEGYVITGYNGGAWDGFGINSSTAAEDTTHLTAVGVINNADAHLAEFHGVTLGSNVEILASYAYYGDANLDGDVNAADFALMGLGSGWYYGDFNYSGTVDAADYALYQASFDALHPVPEPGVVGLMAAGAMGCLRRRRV